MCACVWRNTDMYMYIVVSYIYVYIYIYIYIERERELLSYPQAPLRRLGPFHLGAGAGGQGFQGYDVRISTNRFEVLREVYGLRRFMCLFLRIGAP